MIGVVSVPAYQIQFLHRRLCMTNYFSMTYIKFLSSVEDSGVFEKGFVSLKKALLSSNNVFWAPYVVFVA